MFYKYAVRYRSRYYIHWHIFIMYKYTRRDRASLEYCSSPATNVIIIITVVWYSNHNVLSFIIILSPVLFIFTPWHLEDVGETKHEIYKYRFDLYYIISFNLRINNSADTNNNNNIIVHFECLTSATHISYYTNVLHFRNSSAQFINCLSVFLSSLYYGLMVQTHNNSFG